MLFCIGKIEENNKISCGLPFFEDFIQYLPNKNRFNPLNCFLEERLLSGFRFMGNAMHCLSLVGDVTVPIHSTRHGSVRPGRCVILRVLRAFVDDY